MFYDRMSQSAQEVGMTLSRHQYDQFMRYKELLKEWNEKMNLTAITEDEGIITKHFMDSIKAFKFEVLKEAKTVIDVGTGAGFPGFPIKIMNNDVQLTLLDSLNKRLNFLRAVSQDLEMEHVSFIHSRAEDGGRDPLLRDSFDIAVSRAVANLTLLTELCLPYVKVGGYFIALKGPAVETEVNDAKHAISLLGGKLHEIIEIVIEDTDLKHNLVVIKKLKATPKAYPRSSSALKKAFGPDNK